MSNPTKLTFRPPSAAKQIFDTLTGKESFVLMTTFNCDLGGLLPIMERLTDRPGDISGLQASLDKAVSDYQDKAAFKHGLRVKELEASATSGSSRVSEWVSKVSKVSVKPS